MAIDGTHTGSINLAMLKALSLSAVVLQFTEAEYVKEGGSVCPICRGEDLDYDTLEVSGTSVYQRVFCKICDASWYDTYELAGYGDVSGDDMTERSNLEDLTTCPKCSQHWAKHNHRGECPN